MLIPMAFFTPRVLFLLYMHARRNTHTYTHTHVDTHISMQLAPIPRTGALSPTHI